MNFGEKFPYALLTFSQKFVEAGYWVHLLPKVCRSWLLGTPSPKSLSKLIVGHTFSQKFVEAGYWVHYTPIITRTPTHHTKHSQHTKAPSTHTQSHNPAHTPPPAS